MTNKTNHLESLERALEKKENEQRTEAERKSRHQEASKMLEKRHEKEKKILTNIIFDWGKEFSQTDVYHKLQKNGIYGSRGVYVFGGGWAHKLPYDTDRGCWSRTYFKKDGTFLYDAGYKYMGIDTEILLKTPEEMADRLCFEYLKEFVRTKETLEIYNNIRAGNLV